MARKLVDYKQTDQRWRNKPYAVKGKENSTIGGSGCGPTCVAMVLATYVDPKITPVDTCRWSLEHGQKAVGQGTYYTFFPLIFADYGMTCKQISWESSYGKKNTDADKKALQALKDGKYIIACMGKGDWTQAGHYIILRSYKDGKVHIQDPASVKPDRLVSTWDRLQSQVKYYWIVDPVVQMKVAVEKAPVRYYAGKKYKKIGTLKKGTVIRANKMKGNWFRYGKHRWIYRGRLKVEKVA